jgi:hypothetical protein
MADDFVISERSMSPAEQSRTLHLILTGQDKLDDKVTEIRIDLGTMKTEIKGLSEGQAAIKQDAKDAAAAVKADLHTQAKESSDGLLAAAAVSGPIADKHAQDHKDLWEAITKLTTLSKAMSISGGIIMTILTALVIILGLLQ